MDNVLAVQSLGGNEREKEKFAIESNASFKNYRRIVWANLYYGNLTEFAYQFLRVAAIVFVATKVVEGELSIGDYGVVFFYFAFLAGPAYFISRVWIDMQQHITGVRRVFAMMDLPVEQDQGDRELPRIEGGISIRGAGFVYPDGRRALQNVSFDANVGQIVALVGPTGAGKTSLAYLVPRFHTATEGQVQIDGVDVKDVSMESLRSQITYVFQETQLLADSIVDNIRFGNPDATTDQVESVARTAGIHDFIVSLPDGYQTKLGTTSSKISVGQKQRIAIARGLLRDSRILILDEPTSALDPETEEYLVQALHEAAKNRLVMIIAHRLSTIAQADHIVFLEDGEVREQGSPQELMANPDGAYRRFVELQTTSEE
jgi:ABC-type multidrug transport system fused ATPase/permease subunit